MNIRQKFIALGGQVKTSSSETQFDVHRDSPRAMNLRQKLIALGGQVYSSSSARVAECDSEEGLKCLQCRVKQSEENLSTTQLKKKSKRYCAKCVDQEVTGVLP
jgi:hypothetical protein